MRFEVRYMKYDVKNKLKIIKTSEHFNFIALELVTCNFITLELVTCNLKPVTL